jgi:hypothetical protein
LTVPEIDLHTDRPHAARIYDYLLGGTTNFAADRAAADALVKAMPVARRTAALNRAFMHKAVRVLVDAGIRQFLDIGTGIPTSPNLHETAQGLTPAARVVYADIDPIVQEHSRALQAGRPEGRTMYIDADIREPDRILRHPDLLRTLDLGEPVALTLLTVLHWLPDSAEPHAIVRRLLDALPSGSGLVVSHITTDLDARSVNDAAEGLNDKGSDVKPRGRADIRRFFDGLDLVAPGLTLVADWRPDEPAPTAPEQSAPVPLYVGVALKR